MRSALVRVLCLVVMFQCAAAANAQLDVSVTQKVSRNLRLYGNLLNLNDSLLRYYQGVPDRVLQEEHDHWWSDFGVKVEF